MSTLLEQASLVMIPSGYKEDVVYSVIPSSGAGDLSFTRASDGTRINSAGLVENMPYNILQYSQDFTNGAWNKLGTSFSVTANTTTAPNGTLTASTLNIGANDNILYQAISSGLLNNTYTFSIYAKGSGTFSMRIRLNSTTTTTETKTLSSDWQRFSVTVTQSAAVTSVESYIALNTSSTYYVWGAQTVAGSELKEYFPTTDRQNVPRLNYQNGGGGCPSLLLEKQSTNLVTYSEQFNNAAWQTSGATITANSIVSPDGTQNADTITYSVTSYDAIYQSVTTTNGATYTASVYAKKGNQNFLGLEIRGASSSTDTVFNLNTGVVVSGTGTIESVGNGWYRCSITKAVGNTSTLFIIGRGDSGATGDTAYLWGAQIEQSSYQTSYIPTTSASATRIADSCSKTGISSLIGQTDGTVFVDAYIDNIEARAINVLFYLRGSGVDKYVLITSSGGVQYIDYPNGNVANNGYGLTNGRHKFAIAYANNDFAFYIDGNLIGTDTSGTPSACSEFGFFYYASGYDFPLKVNEAVIFKTRLTNTELAQLTSL